MNQNFTPESDQTFSINNVNKKEYIKIIQNKKKLEDDSFKKNKEIGKIKQYKGKNNENIRKTDPFSAGHALCVSHYPWIDLLFNDMFEHMDFRGPLRSYVRASRLRDFSR